MNRQPSLLWIKNPEEMHDRVVQQRVQGQSVGVVPTMGNLHEGHLSLIRRARNDCDFVVVTLFVNPIQFVAGEDLEAYPRTPEDDEHHCLAEGVDAIFAPSVETMYPDGACTRVQVTGIEEPLCGGNRPGHFVGVATVVAKLFNIVPAHRAYFGEKDFQQLRLIEQMVGDLNFPVEVVRCPIVREPDGLAMSSRNAYLSAQEREQALVLFQSLQLAQRLVWQGVLDAERIRQEMTELISSRSLARIDYVEIVDPRTLQSVPRLEGPAVAAVAVRFGKARLIDNATLTAEG